MRKKSVFLLLLILSSALLFSSCLSTVQLNERAIVQAVGVDWENGRIKLTLQVFSPASGGGTSIGASAENAKIIQAEGATVSEAVQNANLVQGKRLFIGHNRIIIFGSALAKQGLEEILSYFSSDPLSRQNVHLAMAEDKASDILAAKINQGMLPAETLEKIMQNGEENGLIKSVKMFEFLKTLNNQYESSFMPVMRIKKEESGGQSSGQGESSGGSEQGGQSGGKSEQIEPVSSIEMIGTAVFANSKMVTVLDKDTSRGLLWLQNKIRSTSILVETEKYKAAALRVYESKSELIPTISEDNRIHFTLQVNAECIVGESKLREGKQFSMTDVEELAHAGEQKIKQESEAAFLQAVQKYGADIFNLGNLVWQAEPDIWRDIYSDWSSQAKNITLDVQAKLEVNRIGLEFQRDTQNTSGQAG